MTIVHSTSNSPTYNLAFEEYLFTEFQSDFLLFYINQPCVVIGANQAVGNEVNIDYCRANDIKIIRRKSGGGAVYHDPGNLNFSFISSRRADINALSDAFLKPIVDILSELQVPVEIGKRKDLWLPGDLKITGTASQIKKNRELHHGTLLIKTELEKLELSLRAKQPDLTVKATPSVRSRTANILEYLNSTVSPEEFKLQIMHTAAKLYGQPLITDTEFGFPNPAEYQQIYLSNEWNFKK